MRSTAASVSSSRARSESAIPRAWDQLRRHRRALGVVLVVGVRVAARGPQLGERALGGDQLPRELRALSLQSLAGVRAGHRPNVRQPAVRRASASAAAVPRRALRSQVAAHPPVAPAPARPGTVPTRRAAPCPAPTGPHTERVPRLIDAVLPPGSLRRLAQPTFDVNGHVLRPWRATDAPEVEQRPDPGHPAVARLAVHDGGQEARRWVASWGSRWQAETGGSWAVATPTELLGQVSLRRIDLDGGDAEISYWVVPAARGRGVASSAVQAVTAWAFGELGLHRIAIEHSVATTSSSPRPTSSGSFRRQGVRPVRVLQRLALSSRSGRRRA